MQLSLNKLTGLYNIVGWNGIVLYLENFKSLDWLTGCNGMILDLEHFKSSDWLAGWNITFYILHLKFWTRLYLDDTCQMTF